MSASPTRRALITTAGAALTGTVVGWTLHRGTGPDLTFVAQEWLCDALALGMLVMRQADGDVWVSRPIDDGKERALAREEHWRRLQARPRLHRAVMRVAEGGYIPEVRS